MKHFVLNPTTYSYVGFVRNLPEDEEISDVRVPNLDDISRIETEESFQTPPRARPTYTPAPMPTEWWHPDIPSVPPPLPPPATPPPPTRDASIASPPQASDAAIEPVVLHYPPSPPDAPAPKHRRHEDPGSVPVEPPPPAPVAPAPAPLPRLVLMGWYSLLSEVPSRYCST